MRRLASLVGEVDTAEQAVALAVELLPPDNPSPTITNTAGSRT
ncbi:hypothetical protein [Kitasatospora sp. MAP5-34]|nr:hypothetical protein [Kitasatospora sp. MAP5-34]MDH6580257.1 hypothetical protein [Kitasatospora sp. MAP5-34]